jgi:hypothetical protein
VDGHAFASRTTERIIVNPLVTLLPWFSHHPLSSVAFFFGGAALAVVLYTYIHDYKMLTNRGMERGK